MYQPPTVTIRVTYPGSALEPSLFDIVVTSNSTLNPLFPASGTLYDGWCLDKFAHVDIPGTYTAAVYSTYELGILHDSGSPIGLNALSNNLDSINWLLGYYTGANPGITFGEVQGAIWQLVGQDWHSEAAYLGPVDQADVDSLAALALTHDGYVPDAGEVIGVVLDPLVNGIHQQPLIIETRAAKLGDFVWHDLNANGIQDAGEPGIAAATVDLVRDLNGDGLFTGPNEVLATTTTDVNGAYSFKGLTPTLTYQVRFTLPFSYSTGSPQQVDGNPASGTNSDGLLSSVVVLAPGEYNRSIDAGFYKYASLGDRLWLDANGNGQQDAGEVGISGQTVTLIGGGADGLINGIGDTTATTVTGADGIYQFTGLTPGAQYQVMFAKPAGTVFTVQNSGSVLTDSDANVVTGKSQIVTLASGENNATIDAGVLTPVPVPSKLSGYVYQDVGNDGVRNAEPPIAGVTITLNGTDDLGHPVSASTVTNAAGFYEFVGLRPGTYSVTETQPVAYLDGKETAGTAGGNTTVNDVISAVVLTPGSNSVENNFGEITPASIGDKVFNDLNANGLQDAGEGGVAGVTVRLFTCVNNQPGVQVGVDKVTDANGNYNFGGLAPGDYIVQFVAPNGSVLSTANVGGNDLIDSDAGAGGYTGCYTLAAGETNTSVDAGVVGPRASIGDKVFNDLNANGLQDAGEGGVAGVTVRLFTCVNNQPGVQVGVDKVTDANGNYNFGGLAPGDYIVQFVAPNGSVLSTANVGGNDLIDSDAGAGGYTGCYTLAAGENNTSVDAGLFKTASLGDRLWLDANGNGQQDAGEVGISGQTVTLIGGGADGLINGIGDTTATTVTGADGFYQFTGLTPGAQYQVMFGKPAGTVFTVQNSGSTLSDSNADPVTGKSEIVTLASGENNSTLDAGVYAKASIGDRVWLDCNGNGVQDANEVGVANVTVKLLDAGGAVVATQTTDANGNYLFSNLTPGDYSVQFVPLAGYHFTTKGAGADHSTDSDADPVTGKTIQTTLVSGESDLTWDAGFAPLCREVNFDFQGNSKHYGPDGNSRIYTDEATGVSVSARAFSQDKSNGEWATAYVGAYRGGLGVTDSSEGDGSGNRHTIDNVGGRDNFIVLQFSQAVTVDKAYLGYVVGDSDFQVWIGNAASTITTMSNSVLSGLGFTEVNKTTETTARWADINAGGAMGNVLIIAADTTDLSPDDYFKLQNIAVCAPVFCTPVANASIGDRVWCDTNGNGIQDNGEAGVSGVTIKLLNSGGSVVDTTTTDSYGNYKFSTQPGDYQVQVIKPSAFGGFTKANQGSNDAVDSDVDASTGKTGLITLLAGANDTSVDIGLTPPQVTLTYDFNGNSSTIGPFGNTRSYSTGGVSVTASAFSRDSSGKWAGAWLGAYGGGHGVTDSSEGNGSSNYAHTVDNVGRINYVVYQFSQNVVVDKAFLGYVIGDSDLTAWIGSSTTTLTSLNDTVLAGMTKEDNDTTSSTTRYADINAAGKEGNILVIAASTSDTTPDDYFKIQQLVVSTNSTTVTPIAIDLDGDGIKTVARSDSGGTFDLFGTGQQVASGWLSGGDGFLAVDRNGNGKIDNIGELFGGMSKGDGFARLASFDSNHDGVVDAKDADFGSLRIWRDVNGNHKTDAGELMTLAQAGVVSLKVAHTEQPFFDAQGNLHGEHSQATMTDGHGALMTDVYFDVAAAAKAPSLAELVGDDRSLDDVLGGQGHAAPSSAAWAHQDAAVHTDTSELLRRLAALSHEVSHTAIAA